MTAAFYEQRVTAFDQTRQRAWDSWDRVLRTMKPGDHPGNFLDLGCGNGRFAEFLVANNVGNLQYLGVDSSAQLIDIAKARNPDLTFVTGDLIEAIETVELFDNVVCFGVFHHLPGYEFRIQVLSVIARSVAPGGTLAISLWQPKRLANFARKVAGARQIGDLEPNDFLLGWNSDSSQPRYVHHFDDEEINALVTECPLPLVTQFQGYGNDSSNRYLIFISP